MFQCTYLSCRRQNSASSDILLIEPRHRMAEVILTKCHPAVTREKYTVIHVRGCPYITLYRIGGEGSPQFITIVHRGVLQSLLQYYRFGRNIEGLRPFSALHMFLCSAESMHFVSNL